MRDHIELNEHERAWENLTVTYMILQRARELELVSRGPSARKPISSQLEALGVYRTHRRCDCHECRVARSWLKESDLEKWPGIEEVARRKLD